MRAVAGVDIGSVTAKAVILGLGGDVLATHVIYAGVVNKRAAHRCLEEALRKAGLRAAELAYVVTTGYGRDLAGFGDRSITEITCHAKGVHAVLPEVRTVIDVGGQDSKAIALDANGAVVTFRMNDKCAAGTGRFLEEMARALKVPLEEFGDWVLRSRAPAQVSSTCTVFAESEIISLAACGVPKVDIIAGLHYALGRRLVGLVKAVGVTPPVAFTGGVAKNVGLRHVLEELLGIPIVVPEQCQLTGALGAALVALQTVNGHGAQGDEPVETLYRKQQEAPQPACPCPAAGAGRPQWLSSSGQ
jgi:predicted CoA-substrate-specific enzyme activase